MMCLRGDSLIKLVVQLVHVCLAIGQANLIEMAIKEAMDPVLEIEPKQTVDRSGNLVLTPLIESGQIKEAQKQALVQDLEGSSGIKSYSGFFTVNPKYNSNMFFWFFPAQVNPNKAPLLIWLQGGPGYTSLLALFVENGPFFVDKALNLQIRRDYAWTQTHSILYFDNPVGTGFSYTDAEGGYARTMNDVTRDLYSALAQFYKLFPKFATRDLYVTGESFAGRYCPDFAYKIHTENRNPLNTRINLKGVIVGNGFFDPSNCLHYDEELDRLLEGDVTPYPTYFTNVTGFTNLFNVLVSSNTSQPEMSYYEQFLPQPNVRRAIHVGNQDFNVVNTKVEALLINEVLKSSSPRIEKLLDAPEKYQITFYTGQLDLIVPETSTRQMIQNLHWSGRGEYLKKKKLIWRSADGTEILGYVKQVRNLNVLMIRNSGHMAPFDQPAVAFQMINILTSGKKFT